MRRMPTEEFTSFYHRYKKLVLHRALAVTGRREAAEEVAQEVFFYAAKHFSRFREMEAASAGRYLALAAHSRGLDWLRNEKEGHIDRNVDVSAVNTFLPDAEEIVLRQDTLDRAKAALHAMPERYRTVLELYVEGFSPKELAAFLGLSEAAVYKRLQRGFALIRNEVEKG